MTAEAGFRQPAMSYFSDGLAQAWQLLADMDKATFSAVEVTLVSTSLSIALALLAGLPAGFCLGYFSFPGRRALRLVSDTLLAFPTVLIGLIVYVLLTYRGPLGHLGLLLTLGASRAQLAWLTIREARYEIGMVCATAFGRVVTEVGVAMMLGGNIRNSTRTMTTAISLETSKGEFAQGIALGLVLLLIAFAVNGLLACLKARNRK